MIQTAETLALLGQIKQLKQRLAQCELDHAVKMEQAKAEILDLTRQLADARQIIANGGKIG